MSVWQSGQWSKSGSQDLQQQMCLQGNKTTLASPPWHTLQFLMPTTFADVDDDDEKQNDVASMSCLVSSAAADSLSLAALSHAAASISADFRKRWSSIVLPLAAAICWSLWRRRALALASYRCIAISLCRASSSMIAIRSLLLCFKFQTFSDFFLYFDSQKEKEFD